MPRFYTSTLLLLACLLVSQESRAHLLNMTRINVDAGATEIRVTIEIDLGQSLMSPDAYWRATQAPPQAQRVLLEQALQQLEAELVFFIDDVRVPRTLTDIEISAISLEAIHNPLTPQMATLRYAMEYSGTGMLQVAIARELEVPWPCLLVVTTQDGQLPQSSLLTEVDRLSRSVLLDPANRSAGETRGQPARLMARWDQLSPWMMWVAVGFQHIVPQGLDHILFMLGLFFFNRGWRSLLLQVTGFTLAHSITLALSLHGLISVSPSIVEPLIALSIVYVAVDNLLEIRFIRWRMAVIILFGLLHGLGFASVLSDIGLPEGQFLSSLLLFNLGIELGQIAVMLTAFLLVGRFSRHRWYATTVAQPAAIAIAGTGAYWFLKRTAF